MNSGFKLKTMPEAGDTRRAEDDGRLASGLSALAHPARIAIVRQLACRDACCCKEVVLQLDLAQSTVSQHLKVLVQAGLVDYEPNRQRSRYVLNKQAVRAVADAVQTLAHDCCNSLEDSPQERV